MSVHRKARGMRTQLVMANWYKEHGAPYATSNGSGAHGMDILYIPRSAPEVKARRSLDLPAWLRQASKNAGPDDFPWVVFRPDGFGEESIAQWGVLMTVKHHTDLLIEAGILKPE